MKYKTIREAAQAWVSEMEHIPTSAIAKLQAYSNWNDIREIGCPPDECSDELPMHPYMFAMHDSADVDWFHRNLDVVKEIGFKIYESEDFQYVFGIDGCGYDFYEPYWIPLYKARGMHWHKEEDDEC